MEGYIALPRVAGDVFLGRVLCVDWYIFWFIIMILLQIEYAPVGGILVADGDCEARAKACYEEAKENEKDLSVSRQVIGPIPVYVKTSSFLLIEAVRVLIAEGVINHKEVEFWFEGKEIVPTKSGGLSVWPRGFGDQHENLLFRLLDKRTNH